MKNDDRLPSLSALESFVAAARHGSFTGAAKELHVTHGAISRIIRSLEDELGVPLFRRVGKGIELTQTGSAYYPQLMEALRQIRAATRAVRGMNGGNILSIVALPTLAMRRLVPSLHEFRGQNPDILVDLIAKDGEIDFFSEPVDVGICYGTGPSTWSGLEATLLFDEAVGVFCAPSLFRRGIPLRAPSDLLRYPLLFNSHRPDAWSEYFAAFHLSVPLPESAAAFEHFFMLIEAAVAGMGIALLPVFLVREELRTGRLVQPLPLLFHPDKAYYIINTPAKHSLRKVRLFKAWLLQATATWTSV